MADKSLLFAPGDRVVVRKGPPEAHCRVPSYLRGQIGEVTEVAGMYPNPSLMAFHKPGLPAIPLYRVRFRHSELWQLPPGPDRVDADIYEHWLEKAEDKQDDRA